MQCSACGNVLTNDEIICECGTYKTRARAEDIADPKQLNPLQLLILREMLARDINETSRLTATG